MIFSWEDFLSGHSPKEHKVDGSGCFMLLSNALVFWINSWSCNPFPMLLPVMVPLVQAGLPDSWGEPGGNGAEWAFLVSDCWEVAYHIGYRGRDVLAMGENGLSCQIEFSYFCNSCAKKKKQLGASWDSFLCVFWEDKWRLLKQFHFPKGGRAQAWAWTTPVLVLVHTSHVTSDRSHSWTKGVQKCDLAAKILARLEIYQHDCASWS